MKKFFKKGIIGFPIGVFIGYTINIIISLIFAQGYYATAVPQLVEQMGSEINAVILVYLLSGLLGFISAGSSVIFEQENWSILKQTVIHFFVISFSMLPIGYICHWIEHSVIGFLSYFGMFVFMYIIIWVSSYFSFKIKIDRINNKIKQK